MSSNSVFPCPFVSIIVPCFNASKTLSGLLSSLEGQTYERDRYEVICVDNGSFDGTKEIIESEARVRALDLKCVEETRFHGSYAARNRGIEAARGEVLFFTDADCHADPCWLKNGVEAIFSSGRDVILGGAVELTLASPQKPSAVEMFEVILGFSQQRNTEESGYSVTANLICWRESMVRVGKFNRVLRSKGDYEWCARARKSGYRLLYSDNTKVFHPARCSLSSIITKTRRVTGGQFDFQKLREIDQFSKKTSRTIGQQLTLVFFNDRFPSGRQKLAVLGVAFLVYLVKGLEKIRLLMGGRSERK